MEIDDQERAKGIGFLERVKSRQDEELPNTNYTTKNHSPNGRIFRSNNADFGHSIANEREVENQGEKCHTGTSIDWVTEMKVRLVKLEGR